MSIVVSDLITASLAEIRVARAGDVVSADQMALALIILNDYLDALNADGWALYTSGFSTYTLTPALQPHTIGPTGTFVVTTRPNSLLGANLILTAGTIRTPLTLRDDSWWLDVRARSVTSAVPTDLFYSPDFPNGSIYLWPVPSTAYGIEIEAYTPLVQVALTDTLSLPPAYQMAIRLTLAELCASSFGQQVSPDTKENALKARTRAFSSNAVAPNLVTRDAGMPSGAGAGRSSWNYLTGQVESR